MQPPKQTVSVHIRSYALTCSAGSIDEIQRLHILTVPLHEQPRRIAHQAASKTLAVITEVQGYAVGSDEPDSCSLRIIDDQVMDDQISLSPPDVRSEGLAHARVKCYHVSPEISSASVSPLICSVITHIDRCDA